VRAGRPHDPRDVEEFGEPASFVGQRAGHRQRAAAGLRRAEDYGGGAPVRVGAGVGESRLAPATGAVVLIFRFSRSRSPGVTPG
jgi:hypothetical protein